MGYEDIDLNIRFRKVDSPAGRPRDYVTALDDDLATEKTPYASPTLISKGTVQANLGGILELRDTTGGTILLTVDPVTGTVTLAGPVLANVTLNVGSMNNGAITGASSLRGTLTSTGIV